MRNGREAVRLAEQAWQISGEHDASILRTLVAAYAENGQCEQAITTPEAGRKIAGAEGNATLRDSDD